MNRDELLRHPLAFAAPAAILHGLSAEDAERKLAGLPHSVVEILAHMVFWQDWFLDRCSGVATPQASHAVEGWPVAMAADWAPLRERFLDGLDRAMELPEERRIEPPIEFPPLAEYTIADALTHLAQHNSHHLGQIVTLRQALGAWPPPAGGFTW